MIHSQMARDATEVHAIAVQLHSLLAHVFVVAIGFLWTVTSSTMLAFVALTARLGTPVLMLFCRGLAIRRWVYSPILSLSPV